MGLTPIMAFRRPTVRSRSAPPILLSVLVLVNSQWIFPSLAQGDTPPDAATSFFASHGQLFWVIEDWHHPAGVEHAPNSVVTTEKGSAVCEAIYLDRTESAHRLRLRTNGFGPVFEASFELSPTEKGWILGSPRLSDPRTGIEIGANCNRHFQFDGRSVAQSVVQTSAGPIYTDPALCRADAQRGYEYSCEGQNCKYSQASASVFDLRECKTAIQVARSTLSWLSNATESQRLSTLQKTLRRWRDGGVLYSHSAVQEQQSCLAWDIRPQAELRAKLSTTHEDKSTELIEYELAPLQHRAFARWLGGRGGQGPVPLYFGADSIYLEESWLYFSRAACEQGN